LRREHVALIEELSQRLRDRGGETLSLAESCTGGLLASIIASVPGISDVFIGGVVAYSNQVKIDMLDVPPRLLRSVGAVSLPVARAMATGAKKRLKSTWALSITGIAGPGGGSPLKPVGTVCFGVRGPGVDKAIQVHFTGGRQIVQTASAEYAIRLLLAELGSSEEAE
jgi:PncC family amidohydrolase